MLPERDEGALRQFLEGCRDTARAKDHFQIASISLAVKHIAPLAVLQSIYEPEELHCYIERAADDEAVAAAEAVERARELQQKGQLRLVVGGGGEAGAESGGGRRGGDAGWP